MRPVATKKNLRSSHKNKQDSEREPNKISATFFNMVFTSFPAVELPISNKPNPDCMVRMTKEDVRIQVASSFHCSLAGFAEMTSCSRGQACSMDSQVAMLGFYGVKTIAQGRDACNLCLGALFVDGQLRGNNETDRISTGKRWRWQLGATGSSQSDSA